MEKIDKTDFITGKRPIGGNFIHIQRSLITDPLYRDLPFETRMIYGILLDLTYINGERDKRKRRYLPFSSRHLRSIAQCGQQKAQKILSSTTSNNF